MYYTIQSIIYILIMILGFGYLVVYLKKKEENNHHEKKYRLFFLIILIFLFILQGLVDYIYGIN
ncbi:hypothetical protein GOQ27_13975 [Clostridium sp. D2Q-11]|uniref:Uncharacterized protein n=1 Tax=Anaeromonas frigoriresistens TaxID=2683708 RepID=A0A942UVX6_9FIRM|nr:hypothetical protein [Anaeromonas frigoriresistens]MBS4539578.1 hypothetical protein [Anaeromonas frigoriresistens]